MSKKDTSQNKKAVKTEPEVKKKAVFKKKTKLKKKNRFYKFLGLILKSPNPGSH